MTAPVNAMRTEAARVLEEILGEFANAAYVDHSGADLATTDQADLRLALSAIELRVFPLVAYASILEANANYVHHASELYDAVMNEAAGYLPALQAEIPGQMSIEDAA